MECEECHADLPDDAQPLPGSDMILCTSCITYLRLPEAFEE